MEELSIVQAQLETTLSNHAQDCAGQKNRLYNKENTLEEQLKELNKRILKTVEDNGNIDATDGMIEINTGGTIIAAKRSTLTQIKGLEWRYSSVDVGARGATRQQWAHLLGRQSRWVLEESSCGDIKNGARKLERATNVTC